MEPFDFVHQANADYIDQLHEQYLKDPRSVPENWRAFFAGFEVGLSRSAESGPKPALPTGPLNMGVFDMVHSYRELGHFMSSLDPLGITVRNQHPLLELKEFGMTEADLGREVGVGGFLGKTDGTLADLINKLRETYCSTLGVEFIGISVKEQREWLLQRMEPIHNRPQLSREQTHALMFHLIAAEEFEHYLARAYVGTKRFGLEGGDSFIPLMNAIVDEGAFVGGEQFIMAMAHRGRLNTLAHVINKPYEVILSEFEGTSLPNPDDQGDGDVKYHLGYASKRQVGGKEIKVSLLPNPSHLELINPIMQGITRCKQQYFGDIGRKHVVPVLIHGDAAFTGQGVVAETLNLSELAGFSTGGTIHVIVNNQIGFTTPPRQGRFTPYPTDVAKAIQAPIFHVNGDDPEAAIWAAKLAIGFRQEFRCDVMIDLWCYRRNGHNEADEPSFTQPVMYRKIAEHKTTRQLYAERLLREGRITQEELDKLKQDVIDRLGAARDQAKVVKPRTRTPGFSGVWKGIGRARDDWSAKTALPRETLEKIINVYNHLPQGFTVHPKVQKTVVEKRLEAIKSGREFDWGTAEMLAFGSLLMEGYNVRLTGQDVERGTFSHRHAVLFDYNTGEPFFPLAQLAPPDKPAFTVINSMLSEFAVLGFEWGYASADPRNLVLWEAQFGDFVNGAQPIIDQILCAAESKWRYMNGMVLNLPHGYEGQGPEHSNAYLERFLSLCADDNMQVCMLSTPAQYFHALRRQQHRKFRKPLVLMQPKGMLRDPNKSSTIEEFTSVNFQSAIDDPNISNPEHVRRVVLCSGKVYYTLRDTREASKDKTSVALVRVEQFYPFPEKELSQILAKYSRKTEVIWCQEEPANRGGWGFMQPRLRQMLPDVLLSYAGRDAAASPSVGSTKESIKEEKEFIGTALKVIHHVPASGAAQVTR